MRAAGCCRAAASWNRSALRLHTSRMRTGPVRWVARTTTVSVLEEKGSVLVSQRCNSARSHSCLSRLIWSRPCASSGPTHSSVAQFQRVAADALVMRLTNPRRPSHGGGDETRPMDTG